MENPFLFIITYIISSTTLHNRSPGDVVNCHS